MFMSLIRTLFGRAEPKDSTIPIFFTNSLSGKKELFAPLKAGFVTLYSCGPTVYDRVHIGNLRSYVFSDTVARVLLTAGYRVRRVINITDVGHMVGDTDLGEDKMAAGAKRERATPKQIADRYASAFMEDIRVLNVNTSDILFPRATEYIKEQIAMIQTLEEKGFAYRLPDGVYFDTSRFAAYGALGGIADVEQQEGARVAIVRGKRHPHDFVLWRKAKQHDLQHWDSPWGPGNPGWHIECSAMARSLLGQEIDIHTGGMDHIPVHHNNEMAQSEAVSGRTFVRYWLHNAFLTMSGDKISKSLGNVFYLSDVTAHNLHPLALRYFFLQAHYRTPLSFSWDALGAASEALRRLWRAAHDIAEESGRMGAHSDAKERMIGILRDDLATPQAIGFLWETLRDEELSAAERFGVLEAAEAVFGLSLLAPPGDAVPHVTNELPADIQDIVKKRDEAREKNDFAAADRFRDELKKRGYRVEDKVEGTLLTKDA